MVEVDPLETDAGQKRTRLHTVLRTSGRLAGENGPQTTMASSGQDGFLTETA